MQKITELILNKCKTDYFSSTFLEMIMNNDSNDSRYGIIKRAIQNKELVRIRRGLYILGDKYRRFQISKKVLSVHIYTPSYVSFESALSIYGIIPDITQNIVAASFSRSKTFKTKVGIYKYISIPVEPFYFGVKRQLNNSGDPFLLASLERAFCDFVYMRKLKWKDLSLLTVGFRFDEDQLKIIDLPLLQKISTCYPKKFVRIFVENFIRKIKETWDVI